MTFCSFSLLTSSCSEKKQVSKVKWPQRPATPVQSQSKNKTFLAFFLTSDAGSLRSLGTKLLSSLALRALLLPHLHVHPLCVFSLVQFTRLSTSPKQRKL